MNRIIVVRFSSLGDIILSEPVVRALHGKFPDSQITYLTKVGFLPLLELFENLDKVYALKDDKQFPELIAELRRDGVDLVVDLHRNLRSSRLRSRLRVRSVTTRKEWWRRFCSVRFKKLGLKPSHAVERYFAALRKLGIAEAPHAPQLRLPDSYHHWWQKERASRGLTDPYYVIGAGAAHDTKMAPPELWVGVVHELKAHSSAKPLVVGSSGESDMLGTLVDRIGMSPARIVTQEDICNSAAVIAGADFVLSNDSGLSHLAAGLGRPTLALFGPTHPVLGFTPLGAQADFYTVNEYCSPCSLHGSKPCFRDQRYCFTRMEIGIIVEKIMSLVES